MSFLNKIGVIPSEDEIFNSGEQQSEIAGDHQGSVIKNVTRRGFLKATGLASSSLVLGVQLSSIQAATSTHAHPSDKDFAPDVFISMDKKVVKLGSVNTVTPSPI